MPPTRFVIDPDFHSTAVFNRTIRAPNLRARIHRSSAHLPSVFSPSTFSRQIYFQPISFPDIYEKTASTSAYFIASLGGHVRPPFGHTCPPRLVKPAPRWLKAEGRSTKLRCIRAEIPQWQTEGHPAPYVLRRKSRRLGAILKYTPSFLSCRERSGTRYQGFLMSGIHSKCPISPQ